MKLKVIFLKDSKWGKIGEIKEVAPAFFKNVLQKQKIATEINSPEAKSLLSKIQKREKQHKQQVEKLKEIIQKLKTNNLTIKRKVTPKGHLYDKVTEKNISEEILKHFWLKIPKEKIKLNHTIDMPGLYPFTIDWLGVKQELKVNVIAA